MAATELATLALPRAERSAAVASNASSSPSQAHLSPTTITATTLEEVALRLFYLLRSPPLSLAALVRAGLLSEEEDVRGHFILVSTAPAQSPNKTAYSAKPLRFPTTIASAVDTGRATRGTSPLVSPVSTPASGTFDKEDIATRASAAQQEPASIRNGDGMNSKSAGLPSLTQQMQTTSAAFSQAASPSLLPSLFIANATGSPVTAATVAPLGPSSPTSLRVARLSEEAVAGRLANLYAHHPLYALREWLHREAMRLSYASYQDPVSNDIIATAGALQQRDALVTRYVNLYEELHIQPTSLPTAVEGTNGGGGGTSRDPDVVAWSRSLHSLMGCRHQHERHCPHHSLDGFQRPQSPSRATAGSWPRQHGRPKKEATSMALLFVHQLLCSTPKLHPGKLHSQRAGILAPPPDTDIAGGAPLRKADGRASNGLSTRDTESRGGPAGVVTVTFIRPPLLPLFDALRVRGGVPIGAPQRPLSKRRSGNERADAPPRRTPLVVTSLDCMMGVEQPNANEGAPDTATAATGGSPAGIASETKLDDIATPVAIPARRGPRIRLHPSAPMSTTPPRDACGGRVKDGGSLGDFSGSSTANGSRSGSSSSSVSLPVVGEEGEAALSLSEDEESDEEEEEVDFTEESSSSSHSRPCNSDSNSAHADNSHHSLKESQATQSKTQGVAMAGGRVHAAPTAEASTTTTIDFLTSRNGGLLSTAAAAPSSTQQLKAKNVRREETATQLFSASQLEELTGSTNSASPLLAGYTLTRPFTLAELTPAAAQELLHLPFYAQAHELNRLAGLRERTCYQDPYTNCLILTSYFLKRLPHCYGEYCKHCPHGELCQRRQLQPAQQHHRHHGRHHHRHAHHAWRVVSTTATATTPQNINSRNHENMSSSSSCSSGESSDSGASLEEDDDDVDDPATLRFFEELDAADNAGLTADVNVKKPSAAGPQQQQPSFPSSSLPMVRSGAVATSQSDLTTRHAVSSRSGESPSSASSSSVSSSSSSSSSSFFSKDEEEQNEQHRLLGPAALCTFEANGKDNNSIRGDSNGWTCNSAGVVVQVDSLRDLLSWGGVLIPADRTGNGQTADVSDGDHASQLDVPSGAVLPAALERRENGALNDMGVEELLRRREASFEQFSYLDYSGL